MAGVAAAVVAGEGVAVAAGAGAGVAGATAGAAAVAVAGGAATGAAVGAALVADGGDAVAAAGATGVRASALAAPVGADFVAAVAASLAAAFAATSLAAAAVRAARAAAVPAVSAVVGTGAAALDEAMASGAPGGEGAACAVAVGVIVVGAEVETFGAATVGCVVGGVAGRAKNQTVSAAATRAIAPSTSGRRVPLGRLTLGAACVARTAAARANAVGAPEATRGASDSASPSAANRLSAA